MGVRASQWNMWLDGGSERKKARRLVRGDLLALVQRIKSEAGIRLRQQDDEVERARVEAKSEKDEEERHCLERPQRRKLEAQRKSAVSIQAGLRGSAARRRTKHKHSNEQNKAALCLQGCVRGKAARQSASAMRQNMNYVELYSIYDDVELVAEEERVSNELNVFLEGKAAPDDLDILLGILPPEETVSFVNVNKRTQEQSSSPTNKASKNGISSASTYHYLCEMDSLARIQENIELDADTHCAMLRASMIQLRAKSTLYPPEPSEVFQVTNALRRSCIDDIDRLSSLYREVALASKQLERKQAEVRALGRMCA